MNGHNYGKQVDEWLPRVRDDGGERDVIKQFNILIVVLIVKSPHVIKWHRSGHIHVPVSASWVDAWTIATMCNHGGKLDGR